MLSKPLFVVIKKFHSKGEGDITRSLNYFALLSLIIKTGSERSLQKSVTSEITCGTLFIFFWLHDFEAYFHAFTFPLILQNGWVSYVKNSAAFFANQRPAYRLSMYF